MSFTGSKGFHIQSTNPEYQQGQGWSLEKQLKGGYDEIEGETGRHIFDGWEFNIDSDGPYFTMDARKQIQEEDDQGFSDRFSIKRESVQKSIWELQAIQDEMAAYAAAPGPWTGNIPNTIQKYKKNLQAAIDEEAEVDGRTILETELPQATYPAAWLAFQEFTRGTDSYEDEYTVLTRSRTIGLLYNQSPLALTNTARIYTHSSLRSVFGLPAFTYVLMPVIPSTKPTNTEWGWRNRTEEVAFIEGQKAEIKQDWAFAAWSTNIYDYVP